MLGAWRPHDLAVIVRATSAESTGGMLAYGADMWLDTNSYEVGKG